MPVPAESPEYRDLSDWVVMKILDAIKSGVIKPGERLVEREVAEQLGVSRAPVRDAIHELERLGVVTHEHPRGASVQSWTDADALEFLQIEDGLLLLSISLGIDRLTTKDLAELERIVEQTRTLVAAEPVDTAALMALDRKFHMVIAQACQSQRLMKLLESVRLPMELCWRDLLPRLEPTYMLQMHEELLEPLKKRDLNEALSCFLRNARTTEAAMKRSPEEPAKRILAGVTGD